MSMSRRDRVAMDPVAMIDDEASDDAVEIPPFVPTVFEKAKPERPKPSIEICFENLPL